MKQQDLSLARMTYPRLDDAFMLCGTPSTTSVGTRSDRLEIRGPSFVMGVGSPGRAGRNQDYSCR